MTSCSLWYSVCHCSHYLKVRSLRATSVFNYTLLWGLICRHHPLSELALLRESRSLFSSLSLIVLNIKPLCSVLLNRASCGTETLCPCFKFFSYQLTDALISQFLTGPWCPQGTGGDVSDTVLFNPAGQRPISCLYFGESYSPKSLESGFSESQWWENRI